MLPLPSEFEAAMAAQLDSSYGAWLESLQQPSPVSIRNNEAKVKRDIKSVEQVPWCKSGIYLPQRPSFTFDPHFHAGAYYVQEASSMFLEQAITQLTDPSRPMNVLDVSAAPGGKSTHVLSLINSDSLLVSNEVIRSRAAILVENIQKWGYMNVVVTNNDPRDFSKLPGFFDVIVVDAPCSGEGLFRKAPDAIEEWSPANVALCAKRQQRILHDIWPALRQDGILIYSTCTYNKTENENNLIDFAKEHEVQFLPIKLDPAWGIDEVTEEKLTGYRFYPHRLRGEGFFLSALKKKAPEGSLSLKASKNTFSSPAKKILQEITPWIKQPETKTFIQRGDLYQVLPLAKYREIETLTKHLHIVSAGTIMCTAKHEKLIPEHALALFVELNKDYFNCIDLNSDEALKYLRKDTLQPDTSLRGFTLIVHQGLPLGWANVLHNRMNNLYPAEWRIRSQIPDQSAM